MLVGKKKKKKQAEPRAPKIYIYTLGFAVSRAIQGSQNCLVPSTPAVC